ncbi:unnamed protein product [Parascedosporium putredinis]|uniref:phosphatidylserine decarboxylase n=1 Tax=Parascedosporium putredinis TaxID=1442378 RepID=A0A9P1M991_9PEZI|nr:unnamed protein product [Parascedosporium putredinis]CAI7994212.1 unnamed protein product [Parascedosporium putredinis]
MWILEWLHWAADYLMSLNGSTQRTPCVYTHDESVDAGRREAKPSSKRQIKGFVDAYHINMNDFEPSDIDAYDSFESFFIRHHTPESRPIYEETDPTKAVVVADSRVVTYESVPKLRKLWVKGRNFSMAELTMDMELGDHFADSAVASFRLSPQDYHRYHSPVSGKIKLFRSIPGDYYQVDPVALRSDVDILTRNHREFVVINSEEFGDVLFVAIGATDVGTVQIHDRWQRPGAKISKGEELGKFQFGGSSIIVAFDQNRIQFDQDLIDMSNQEVQVSVEMGMSLGKSRKLKA